LVLLPLAVALVSLRIYVLRSLAGVGTSLVDPKTARQEQRAAMVTAVIRTIPTHHDLNPDSRCR
jgi:hypothetical protein